MQFQPDNLIVRWNRIVNPPTRDEEVNFEELDGWNAGRIKRKIEEAKIFARDKHV